MSTADSRHYARRSTQTNYNHPLLPPQTAKNLKSNNMVKIYDKSSAQRGKSPKLQTLNNIATQGGGQSLNLLKGIMPIMPNSVNGAEPPMIDPNIMIVAPQFFSLAGKAPKINSQLNFISKKKQQNGGTRTDPVSRYQTL